MSGYFASVSWHAFMMSQKQIAGIQRLALIERACAASDAEQLTQQLVLCSFCHLAELCESLVLQGNMYVRFDIKFPEQLDVALCQQLAAILPGQDGPSASELEEAEEHQMKVVDIEEELKGRARERQSSAAYNSDSDDEGGPGGQRVQCAQQ